MTPDVLSHRDGTDTTVTLFNPEKLNALNAFMWRHLAEVFAAGGESAARHTPHGSRIAGFLCVSG